ncbi:MAG: GNAT family N-acetyltransferase [Bacteroidota bacterium]
MIRGSNVLLRAMEPSDVDLMMIYENDPENWAVSGTVSPYSRYTIEQFYENATQDIFTAKQLRLAIELTTESERYRGKTIGFVDLFDFDPLNRKAGVGILIGDYEERRKGYASEALNLFVQHAFNILNIHQIYCHIELLNVNSIKLFERAGFKRCGILKDWILYSGEWRDVLMMQLISSAV